MPNVMNLEIRTQRYLEFYGSNGVPQGLQGKPRPISDQRDIKDFPAWCHSYAVYEVQELTTPNGEVLRGEQNYLVGPIPILKERIEGKPASEWPPLKVTSEMREVIEKGKAERAAKSKKS